MSVPQKTSLGRDRGMRIKTQAILIATEAVAQAMDQLNFEREHMEQIRRTAVAHLRACEVRVEYLQKHIAELKSLASEIDTEAAA